jgi:hypothetical protein
MAQQESFIKLKGKIGDLTFFKTKTGYQAREKGGVSADRIANDPAYLRTRENNAEFGRACSSSKKLRDVLRSIILLTSDTKMANRLTSRMARIIKADSVNIRGERKVLPQNVGMLKDFSFNASALLNTTFFVNYLTSFDRVSGEILIELLAFNPEVAIAKPAGATHYQFNAAAAIIDFEGEGSTLESTTTASSSLITSVAAKQIILNLPPNSTLPMLLVFGISFYQEVNGISYSLNNGAYNAIGIIAIDLLS